MRHQKNTLLLCLILILLILLSLVSSCGEPFYHLVIENQTAQDLTIYVNDRPPRTVQSGGQVQLEATPAGGPLSIVAKDNQGQTVFSRKFSSRQEMQKVDSKTFKVVITAPQNK